MTNKILERILPTQADNKVSGLKLPVYVFTLLSVVSTVRSCIHLLSPDGGAGTIAGMDLTVAGAPEIVFSFALWGSAQLIYALIQLVVAFRYRSLVTFMYLLLIGEALLRMLVGRIKPVHFLHRPPGGIANYVMIPLAVVMLVLCFVKPRGEPSSA